MVEWLGIGPRRVVEVTEEGTKEVNKMPTSLPKKRLLQVLYDRQYHMGHPYSIYQGQFSHTSISTTIEVEDLTTTIKDQ